MKKSNKLFVLSSMILVGFVFSIIFHYVWNIYFKLPNNIFGHYIWPTRILGNDFIVLIQNTNLVFSNPEMIWRNYFPFSYIFVFLFASIKNVAVAYTVFTAIFLGYFINSSIKALKSKELTGADNFRNIFIITFLSYPFLMLIDSGNFSMLLFVFFAVFIYFYKSKEYLLSNIFLIILNALNPFYSVFSSLLLFKRRYKDFAIVTIVELLLLYLNIGNKPMPFNEFFNNMFYVYKDSYLSLTNISSFLGMLKVSLCNLNIMPFYHLVQMYPYLCLAYAFFAIFFAWKERIFWKKIALLTFVVSLVPIFIFDYDLIFLFVPIWLFVKTRKESSFDLFYTILFGLLLLPKAMGIYINPLLMLLLTGLIIFEQFKLKQLKESINE